MQKPDLDKLPLLAKKAEAVNKKFFATLKKGGFRNLDDLIHPIHDEVFKETDCMTCGNCCKTTSPIFYQKDIERLSKHLRIKPYQFIEKYLHMDEDDDYVLNSAPCPFLDETNACTVYDNRPTACREYPHTNRKNIRQLLDLTLKNTAVCPAVYQIVERLKEVVK